MPEAIVKALATINSTDSETDAPHGSFEAILSAPTLDRDGDTLGQDGWKTPLPDRIHIDLDHEMSVAGTVGSAEPFFDSDGTLRIKGTYASTARAQEVRTLVNEGHITTMSVAFMTDRHAKDGSPNRELLNGAFVAVPANREARVLASKALVAKAGARNSASDSQMITAIHDAAVALGAECVPAPSDSPGSDEGANKMVRESFVVGKGLSGSVEDLRDRLTDALQDVVGDDCWAWVRATFLDAGGTSGTIVYDLGDETYSRTFDDADGLITLGTVIECVTVVTSVAPADVQVDDDPSDAVEGAADEHDPEDDAETRSFDRGGSLPPGTTLTNKTGKPQPILSQPDLDAFLTKLEAITKTSGLTSGTPDSPADSPVEPPADAAPSGPADAAGDAADKAAEEMAQKAAAEMLAGLFHSDVVLSTLEP